MKKIVVMGLLGVVISASVSLYLFKGTISRVALSTSLFSGDEQYEYFNRLAEIFPVSTMNASLEPFDFPDGDSITLPKFFSYEEKTINAESFLNDTDTSALLIVNNGKVAFERYMLTGGRDVNWLSMSVAKSFIATGIGIAVDDGLIDIHKPITSYVPSLVGSAYDNVMIKDVLQMSSGAGWNEDYSDPDSDILRLGRLIAFGGSLDDFVATLKRENTPGTVNRYNSADTQALGMLLVRATGTTITRFLQKRLWQPLGMESDGYWLIDDNNVEMAFMGLNATARDYAKLGELYRLKGNWQGKQIVSEKWISESTTPDAPHVMPNLQNEYPLGYGYQWWVPESSEGEYSAIGVYNQFIYVNPTRDLVIVKLSANSNYGTSDTEAANQELTTIEFFRSIASQFPIIAKMASK